MAIDYKKIAEVAISGYSTDLVPSIDNNTPTEAKYVDRATIKPYQWTTDVAAANKLLDSIGAKRGSDGIRVLKNGTRLGPFELECPFGWSDWNATLEIVMQSCKPIGIEMRTKFPEHPVWINDFQTGSFDLSLFNPTENLSPSQPWDRAFFMMYSKGVAPIGEVAYYNQGRFHNDRANELLEEIPTIDELDTLKKLYTELTVIYLKNIPTIPLMYRPWWFHTVNESIWKGFPTEDSGKDVPPQVGMVGAGVKALYQIEATSI
jgi:peptide/nickel transport system substrate-binding protein